MIREKLIFIFCFILQFSMSAGAQSQTFAIRPNQVGYLPNSIKTAAVINTESDSFKILTSDMGTVVFEGQLLPPAYYSSSGEDVSIADFTLLTTPGEYVVVVDDLGRSVPFRIAEDVFTELSKSSLKYYYFNRASAPVLSEYGGVWAREAGHPDTTVIVHPSAATASRPAGTIISTPGGWYDAGDYNKYIVSSGGTVFTLLSAYETYPEFYDTLDLNIPESGNAIPDILDEALYNIKWMMTMQDEDGGVYNKTTDAYFGPHVMPADADADRYVVSKGTAATLDFAAVMAMTARIFKKFDQVLADSALAQAERAWQWARANPDVVYTNPGSSGGFPGISTGEYSDSGFDDEFTWSAAELYVTTGDSNYYKAIDFDQNFGLPGWPVVETYGLLSLIVNEDSLTDFADMDMIKAKYLATVSNTKNHISTSPYRIPGDFFYWSGNNAFGNWGMLFMQAFRLTGDASYYNAAIASLDYLLGKNATTYCFVTGTGSKSPMHPHHRISSADGIADPPPGMLVGGANSGDVSDCGASSYPSTFPAKSYLDAECSYSTNEVAIGINAVLAFLTGSVQAEYLMNFTDTMPRYFSVSTNRINLGFYVGSDVNLVIEGNTDWELTTPEDWIYISATSGSGNAKLGVNSKTENPTESERSGKIYVYSQNVLTDSITVTQNGKRYSFRIEAEDYSDKSGTQTEATGDEGGGENIGYVDIGDWINYNLDVSYDGYYNVTIRHAGWAGNIDIIIDNELVRNVTFPATADWQVWESHIFEMPLPAGLHTLKLEFNAAGTNLNWYQFDWKAVAISEGIYTDSDFLLFPNPASRYITLKFSDFNATGTVKIISLEGRVLMAVKTSSGITDKINISGLASGVYLIRAEFPSQVFTRTLKVE